MYVVVGVLLQVESATDSTSSPLRSTRSYDQKFLRVPDYVVTYGRSKQTYDIYSCQLSGLIKLIDQGLEQR